GMIYVLASFIFFKGIFSQHMRLVAISLIVVFIYGSLIWYIFPIKDGISWEGHLGGFLSGLFLAVIMRSHAPDKRKYAWENEDYNEEDDPFLRHFDEEGNFIEDPDGLTQKEDTSTRIIYHFKKKDDTPPTD
ncbi:MAG: rhomboid family intramembrane serine protease, partial [Bacteroidia bacterium]|nr:rhomboid family intramembrane serine protease [Bacteroidia bacterium]